MHLMYNTCITIHRYIATHIYVYVYIEYIYIYIYIYIYVVVAVLFSSTNQHIVEMTLK